jgi:Papain-like cysteine protease AvrRpt2
MEGNEMLRKSLAVPVHAVGEEIPQLVGCQDQKQELWCWAACIQMALRSRSINKEQCAIVRAAFPHIAVTNHIDCCQDPEKCDRDCDPSEVAAKFGLNTIQAFPVDGQLTLSELRTEINTNKRPVCVGWIGTPKHMVLVVGVSEITDDVVVCDPDESYLRTTMSFAQLQKPEGRSPDWEWKLSWRV